MADILAAVNADGLVHAEGWRSARRSAVLWSGLLLRTAGWAPGHEMRFPKFVGGPRGGGKAGASAASAQANFPFFDYKKHLTHLGEMLKTLSVHP